MLNGSEGVLGLRKIPRVKFVVDSVDLTKRDLIIAIGIDNLKPTPAVRAYETRGVNVNERVSTSLDSKRMLESLGLQGAVRVSPPHCNSAADIDRFLTVTLQITEAVSAEAVRSQFALNRWSH
jgi:selenocysteine lyase/cysteine desulfurase